jgi:hypothetical protein
VDAPLAAPEQPLVRVFISYAHASAEHVQRVRELWLFLRSQGIDAKLDMSAAEHPQDWGLWMLEQVREADFVLVIASAAYRRRAEGLVPPVESRGVPFEAILVREAVYADPLAARRKFLPVVLGDGPLADIPAFLGPTSGTHYRITELTPAGADPLLRLLTGRPALAEPELGRPAPFRGAAAQPAGHPAAPPAGPGRAGLARPAGQLSTSDRRQLVDGLLAIAELATPARWQQLIDLLPDHVRHAVPRLAASRAEAIALLWTCENYPGAWPALVEALRLIAPNSPALDGFAAEVDRLGLGAIA